MKILLFNIIMLACLSSFGQTEASQSIKFEQTERYKLYKTENMWTFLKLDTRNGRVWQVHYSLKSTDFEGELPVSTSYKVYNDEEENGRFTLYKTDNMYNFLLLDQINGNIWQVQWNMNEENRGAYKLN